MSDSNKRTLHVSDLEWRGDHLGIVTPEIANRLHRKRLSPSAMNALSSCPSRWAVDQLGERVSDPFSPAEVGTAAHSVFEHLYQDEPEARTKERARELLTALMIEQFPHDDEQRVRWGNEVIGKMRGLWDIENPSDVDVVATEIAMGRRGGPDVVIDGVPIVGVVDRIDRRHDGALIIKDYKTGKKKSDFSLRKFGDDEGDQQRIYFMGYQTLTDEPVAEAHLLYTAVGESRKVSTTKQSLGKTRKKLVSAWTNLEAYNEKAEFPTRASGLCGWCTLVNLCPTAAAAGKTHDPRAPEPLSVDKEIEVSEEAPAHISAPPAYIPPPSAQAMLADMIAAFENVDAPTEPFETDGVQSFEGERPIEGVQEKHTDSHEEDTMTTITTPNIRFTTTEGKPWDGDGFNSNGDLDPASATAIGAAGLVSDAIEYLHAHNIPITKTSVHAMAQTLASIVTQAQEQLSGHRDLSRGLNTRLRCFLKAALPTMPMPVGGTPQELDKWATSLVRRLVSSAEALLIVAEDNYPKGPWRAFAAEDEAQQAA